MKFVIDILKGVVIGIANAIPGVSGGTMMVSMGIYDDIIYCITHLFKQLKKSIMILMPYFIGMAVGIVGLAYFIKALYANVPFQTSMVFIGLILGGVPILTKRIKGKKIGISHGLIFLLFFALIIGMELLGGDGSDVVLSLSVVSLIQLFVVGVIASATMVIPGVSGSMMLMILGYYNPVMNSITTFVDALKSGQIHTMLTTCGYLIPFGLGVVVGIFAIAKLIELLLHKYEALTYCGIMGLVISSPIVILMRTSLSSLNAITIITGVIALVVGIVAALLLSRAEGEEETKAKA